MNALTRTALLVLIIGAILVIFAPFVFTRNGPISFTNTGEIGDTIGGITAPITSLIGSVLVFLALRAQIRANEIIQGQIDSQVNEENRKKEMTYVSDLYKYLLKSIDDSEYDKSKGNEAVTRLLHDLAVKWDRSKAHEDNLVYVGKISPVYNLLKLIKLFLLQIEKSKIGLEDKAYLKNLLSITSTHCLNRS